MEQDKLEQLKSEIKDDEIIQRIKELQLEELEERKYQRDEAKRKANDPFQKKIDKYKK